MSIETLWFKEALLPNGWASEVRISLQAGYISQIETGVAASPYDQRHAIGLPGLPNLHSHAFQRLIAGATEYRGASEDSFWTWRTQMYAQVSRLTPEDVEAITALAYMEMLETGFTRVGEFHYLHNDTNGSPYDDRGAMAAAVATAAQGTGIGLTLLPVFYAHGGFQGMPAHGGQKRFINGLDSFADLLSASRKEVGRLDEGVVGIAPHSLRAVMPDELHALVPMAEGAPIHIHIAEQLAEVEDCLTWSGQRPVEWLMNHVEVNPHWCLVHATHMTDMETQNLAKSGAVAGLCPITEGNLGDGLFPANAFVNAGGSFGVGSDSNVRIDAAEELRLLEYGQRLLHKKRNILAHPSSGATLYCGAVQGGAQALGVASGLAVGHSADLVSLEAGHASLLGKSGNDLLDAYVFAAGTQAIDCVWRFGRKWVSSGRHIRRDAILSAYAKVVGRLSA